MFPLVVERQKSIIVHRGRLERSSPIQLRRAVNIQTEEMKMMLRPGLAGLKSASVDLSAY